MPVRLPFAVPMLLLIWALLFPAAPRARAADGELFRSDSKRFGNAKMDIVLTEIDRQPRTSILEVQITSIGSSVGSSFFFLCSIRDLARQRGHFRYIAKAEEQPRHHQMLVGFLNGPTEEPARLDQRLAGQPVIDLDYFAPICDKMQ